MEKYFEINEDGVNIRSKIYFNNLNTIKKVVIFAHGFGGSKDNKSAEKLAERMLSKHKDIAMITFNWPCHGDDVKKKIVMSDCDQYLELVLKYVKERFHPEKLFASGVSFGCYMILKRIHHLGNPFDKIVLRSPALDMYEALTRRIMRNGDLEKLNKGKDVSVGYDQKIMMDKKFLEELEENDVTKFDYLEYAEDILMIHGLSDDVIPNMIVQEFSENNVIDLVLVEGADHRFRDPKKYEIVMKKSFEFYQLS